MSTYTAGLFNIIENRIRYNLIKSYYNFCIIAEFWYLILFINILQDYHGIMILIMSLSVRTISELIIIKLEIQY
jgi:hypothetical protein